MGIKDSRIGKHGAAEPTKRFPGTNIAGVQQEPRLGEPPTKRHFIGNGLRNFYYIDPDTGARHIIHADNADQARTYANNAGLILERKYKRRKNKKR